MNTAKDNTGAKHTAIADSRISALKDMEIEFHGLVCMATILVDKLDRITDEKNHIETNDYSVKIRVDREDIRVASFIWYDVLTRCEQIKAAFLERLYPTEVQP
ncbi:hypothetical protein EV217_2881 [Phyllobacterium myrsinacearum]|nr:hypothetical protein EV217_2881 [Phyllobacterium myrsinacearum]